MTHKVLVYYVSNDDVDLKSIYRSCLPVNDGEDPLTQLDDRWVSLAWELYDVDTYTAFSMWTQEAKKSYVQSLMSQAERNAALWKRVPINRIPEVGFEVFREKEHGKKIDPEAAWRAVMDMCRPTN